MQYCEEITIYVLLILNSKERKIPNQHPNIIWFYHQALTTESTGFLQVP